MNRRAFLLSSLRASLAAALAPSAAPLLTPEATSPPPPDLPRLIVASVKQAAAFAAAHSQAVAERLDGVPMPQVTTRLTTRIIRACADFTEEVTGKPQERPPEPEPLTPRGGLVRPGETIVRRRRTEVALVPLSRRHRDCIHLENL